MQDDEEDDEGASSDIQPASCVHDEGQRVELVEEPAQLAHTSAGQEQEVGENYPLNSVAFSPGGQGKPGFPCFFFIVVIIFINK